MLLSGAALVGGLGLRGFGSFALGAVLCLTLLFGATARFLGGAPLGVEPCLALVLDARGFGAGRLDRCLTLGFGGCFGGGGSGGALDVGCLA
ncbi:MAG TPA: hypothetical protein VG432_15920, partial [Gemmatimonadaceae bacterium]|nr:hypothetical protein [Gemmatimonadaceae bacterium]